MKLILFCTLHSNATRFRYTAKQKYFTFGWWKFVYSPTQTLNLDWYKACIIITIEKYGAYERSNNNEAKWRENPNYNFRFDELCVWKCRENPKERRLHHTVGRGKFLLLRNQSRTIACTQTKNLTTISPELSRTLEQRQREKMTLAAKLQIFVPRLK